MLYRAAVAIAVLALSGANAFVVAPPSAGLVAAASQSSRICDDPIMGRGDKRTMKGKRKAKSFGVSRPRNAEIRKRREGPGPDLGVPSVVVFEPEPVVEEPVVEEPEPEPVAVVEEPEPEPVVEEAPALSAAEIMAAVKALRAELPKADLKTCKAAIETAGGDVEAAKAAMIAEFGAEWEAVDAAAQAALQEGLLRDMQLKDEKAKKKFEKEQAKAAAAEPEPEPAPEPEPEPAPEAAPAPVAEAEAETVAEAPAADEAAPVAATSIVKPDILVAKAGLSAANAGLIVPTALLAKAGLAAA